MKGRILLPLDGNELAEAALPYGEELAARLHRELVLLHVPGRDDKDYGPIRWMYLDRLAEYVANRIRNRQADGRARVSTMQLTECSGSICDLVAKNDIGLIVASAGGTSGTSVVRLLGCVSNRACPAIPVPVIRVSLGAARRSFGSAQMINRILVPLDGSDTSRLALPVAAELAAELDVGITLFQAAHASIPFVYTEDGSTTLLDYVEMNELATRLTARDVTKLETELKEKGLDVNHLVINGFNTPDEIVEAGEKIGAGLIVISAEERLGLLRRFFHSLSEKVALLGDIPVVQVHPRAS